MTDQFPRVAKSHLSEMVAGYIHYIWAEWVKALLSDWSPQTLERCRKLAATRYKDLSDEDKEKRRLWAREILKMIGYK